MKRRFLLKTTSVATATAALTACNPPHSQPKLTQPPSPSQPSFRWRMATSWPKSLNIVFGTAELICRRVGELTNGRFAITPYAAGELVPGLEVLNAVSAGTVECGHTASYYYINKNPALAFGTTIPFGLNAQQQNAWFYHAGGLEAMHKLYAEFSIINFPAGSTGAQMGGWFVSPIQRSADLKGLKMRIPGLGGQVMTRLGVEVKVLLGEEIFAALEQGNIQAAEWVGPYEDEKLGLNRVAPYYYYPGWWEPGTTYEIQINRNVWNQLPKDYQGILQAAVAEAHGDMLSQYDAANGAALERLVLTGTKLLPFSLEILQASEKAAFELYEETATANKSFKEIYENWKAFRRQVYQWNRINELGFANFAMRNSSSS